MSKPVIGVFDSGFGGLTVLRALLALPVAAQYLYLGDTARLPYGAKSRATIVRYAVESARFLVARGADFLVIACNTATALALEDIRAAVAVPVVGVIAPGAQACRDALREGDQVLVLATEATVQSHAYRTACEYVRLRAVEMPCPLLVPLIEEGWVDHPVTRDVIRIYLAQALAASSPQAVLLGCTHYPLIANEISRVLAELDCDAKVIDSAAATAHAVLHHLGSVQRGDATFRCYATDSVEKFRRLGETFLGRPMETVELLDLGG